MRQAGTFEQSLEAAKRLGNDQIDPALVERLKYKIAQVQGKGSFAPPPAWKGMPSTGNVRIFALLIDFPDYPHIVPATTVDSMLFGAGEPANFPLESLTSYYQRSSYGLLDLGDSVTFGWYRAPYNRSAVVENSAGRENLIKEALNSFDLTHDFSVYDNNSDGTLDYFIVMWTGPKGPWASFWWGYYNFSFDDVGYLLDGKKLGAYSWQWEADVPTVVIHETGHALGLPDYYDYDGTVGPGGGTGRFDPMDANSYDHNSFSKWILGWLTPSVVNGAEQTRTLNPLSQQPEALLVWPGGDLGNPSSEYFLVENRQSVANDDTGFLPNGLAIWHVDATQYPGGGNYLYNNSSSSHKLIRLMEADGLEEIETTGAGADNNDLYNQGDTISPVTHPSSARYDGTHTCVAVGGIIDLGNDAPMIASVSATGACVRYDSHGGLTEVDGNGNGVVDPGETWELSVSLRNDGPLPAGGVSADLTVDPATQGSVFLLQSHSNYGTIDSAQVVSSLDRFRLGDDFPCGGDVVLSVSGITSINPAGTYPDEVGVIRIPVGEGVMLFEDNFETNKGWQRPFPVQDEWQLGVPQGLGFPDPDPVTGFDGPSVMGTDLTGFGVEPGNYPTGRVAQIRTPDIPIPAGSAATEIEYARWLNVAWGDYGRVGVGVPGGGGKWFPNLEEQFMSTWTIDKLDIRDVTAGKDRLVVWFTLTSDARDTNSGWNIDAFKVRGRSCQAYSPTVLPGEATRLRLGKAAPGQLQLNWDADCGGGSSYAVYRGDLEAGYASIAPEPGLCDVTGTSATIPLGTGKAEFFLVVPHMGGTEGSYGTSSTGAARPPAAGACYPQGAIAACAN